MPWLIVRSLRFKLYNSSYRGLRFGFAGGDGAAYTVFLLLPILTVLTLYLLAPFTHYKIKQYQHNNSRFGDTFFRFDATVGGFYSLYLKALGVLLGAAAIAGLFSAPKIGANAFALPDGSIVMLDELVALTRDDNEILAVLAHERGHVEQRHALRMALQSSAVGLVMTWYMGDISTILATVPAMVVQASYSRDMERESDEYAARTLRLNGLSPCLLTDMLDKLEASHAARQSAAKAEGGSVLDYLASHPPTQDRAGRLCPAR